MGVNDDREKLEAAIQDNIRLEEELADATLQVEKIAAYVKQQQVELPLAALELQKAGVDAQHIIDGAAVGAVHLAHAGSLSIPDAARIVEKASSQFHPAVDPTQLADALTLAAHWTPHTALAEAEAERDAALAVIEQAKDNYHNGDSEGRMWAILAQSPASALAKVKADAWDEAAARIAGCTIDEGEMSFEMWQTENPYREAADRG